MTRRHVVISCTVSFNEKFIHTYALVHTDASGFAFIDNEIVDKYSSHLEKLKQVRGLEVIVGRLSPAQAITHITRLPMDIQNHTEAAPFS